MKVENPHYLINTYRETLPKLNKYDKYSQQTRDKRELSKLIK